MMPSPCPARRSLRALPAAARVAVAAVLVAAVPPAPLAAVQRPPAVAAATVSDADLQAATFRMVGPYRGGRVTAVDGIPEQPHTFWFGGTGGGVWKTESAGQGWTNVTDGWLDVGSIGAVEVADADPSIVYVGTGSADIRGNVSVGRGTWRSRDAGDTWTFVGLRDAGQVARIRTHPSDPNTVWLAATGQPFGRNDERGVFKSTDGGDTWRKVLFHSDSVGAIDLALHPTDPEVLYAALWRGERKPWTMISGARTGGVYRSDDGGETWTKLAGGLPGAGDDEGGLVGKIGLAVTPAAPDRVWAMVEAPDPKAGLYRSDDRGATWTLVNDDYGPRSRPWYYMHVYADPVDADVIWAMNSGYFRSTDAGRTFQRVAMPHSDHHDMWINPLHPEIILNGNDGGATVSFDGGEHWSTQLNQPTAEFYNVAVDDAFPYRIYGSQQDNSTISVPTAATGQGITLQHWRSHGGCETGPVVPRPDTSGVVYGGCFGGRFARADQVTEQFRQIRPYPQAQDAMPESALRFRVQWNFPVELSPHDPLTMYYGSNVVHRSRNEGQGWDVISPDLTTNDTARFDMAGGPINADVTGVEIWSALLAIQESPHVPGEIWTGSNDGRVMLTRDGGTSWSDVTPTGLPEPSTVNRIHLSTHRPGKAYVVAYRYRYDDWAPYVYRTDDHGATWTRIADGTRGVPADWTSRSLVEDPVREGLLFLGTEFGLFVSFDDGGSWRPFKQNLPRTPVTDLVVQERWGDMVVATQGRSFWVLDDLTLLRGVAAASGSSAPRLFDPRPAYRSTWQDGEGHYARDHVYGAMIGRDMKARNAPEGAVLYYHLPGDADRVSLEIVEGPGVGTGGGASVRTFDGLPTDAGSHRFVWDLRYPGPGGPRAVPGRYRVRLQVDGAAQEAPLEVRKDPRLVDIPVADLQAQFDFLMRTQDAMERLTGAVQRIQGVRTDVREVAENLSEARAGAPWLPGVRSRADTLTARLDRVADELVQTEGGGWDREAKLRRQIAFILNESQTQRGEYTDARPTDQWVERLGDVVEELDVLLLELDRILDRDLAELNDYLEENGAGVRVIVS
ncbi:MAG: hypothetical protein RJQ04_05880 [Longimicrobiales bacterium]